MTLGLCFPSAHSKQVQLALGTVVCRAKSPAAAGLQIRSLANFDSLPAYGNKNASHKDNNYLNKTLRKIAKKVDRSLSFLYGNIGYVKESWSLRIQKL